MFWLAVSLAVTLASDDDIQAARLPDREVAVWNQIRPSLVTMYGNGKATGVAALVDDSGYFVAHNSSVVGVQPWGTTSSGKQIPFSIISKDRATSLVLLKTNVWTPGVGRPFHSPTSPETEGVDLIAALPSGPLRMTYGRAHKFGVLEPTRRMLPFTEIRFEATSQQVGGALIFSSNGDLIGSVTATLVGQDDQRVQGGYSNSQVVQSSGGRFGAGGSQSQSANSNQYSNSGPSEMTIAYTVSAGFIRHVIDGFLSSSHSVDYAMIGVFCIDAVGGGAQIQTVTPGSPADKAGLRPGDVLMSIGSNQIQDQVAFAEVMLQQKVGKPLGMMVQRGSAKLIVDVTPAKAAN